MKIIKYSDGKQFTLTDSEFEGAIKLWNQKMGAWCTRLEILLSPYYQYVETPPSEVGYEVYLYLNPSTKTAIKFYKQGEQFYKLETNQSNESKLYPVNLTKEQESSIINQEDYYSKKLNLNSGTL